MKELNHSSNYFYPDCNVTEARTVLITYSNKKL